MSSGTRSRRPGPGRAHCAGSKGRLLRAALGLPRRLARAGRDWGGWAGGGGTRERRRDREERGEGEWQERGSTSREDRKQSVTGRWWWMALASTRPGSGASPCGLQQGGRWPLGLISEWRLLSAAFQDLGSPAKSVSGFPPSLCLSHLLPSFLSSFSSSNLLSNSEPPRVQSS